MRQTAFLRIGSGTDPLRKSECRIWYRVPYRVPASGGCRGAASRRRGSALSSASTLRSRGSLVPAYRAEIGTISARPLTGYIALVLISVLTDHDRRGVGGELRGFRASRRLDLGTGRPGRDDGRYNSYADTSGQGTKDLRLRKQHFPKAEELVFDRKRGFVPVPIILRKLLRHMSAPELRVLVYLQTRCSKYFICHPQCCSRVPPSF